MGEVAALAPRSRPSPSPVAVVLVALALTAPAAAGAEPHWSPATGATAQALSREGDRKAGAEAYEACAACHGVDGSGRSDGTFPRIAGQHASVVVKQINDIREGRRGNPIMASHVDALTDPAEMADLAAYVASLSPSLANAGNGKGDAAKVQPGGVLYQRDCARCHGAAGAGDAAHFVPIVAGQHYAYLLRQLRAIAGSLRRNAHPEMVDAVFDYRDDELRSVAAYLASLPWPAPAVH